MLYVKETQWSKLKSNLSSTKQIVKAEKEAVRKMWNEI